MPTPAPRRPASSPGKAADLPALTGLRGLLALWVVTYHATIGMEMRGISLPAQAPLGIVNFLTAGSLAVEMFFVLSGFLMVHVHARDFAPPKRSTQWLAAAARFWGLRVIRLWPVHALVIAIYGTINLWGFDWPVQTCGNPFNRLSPCDRFATADLPSQLLLVAAWGDALLYRWNFVSWSISAEWLAYLAFPVLVLATSRIAAAAATTLAFILLAASGPYLAWLGPMFHGLSDSYSALRVVPGFTAGCLLAQAFAGHGASRIDHLALAAAAALIFLVTLSPVPMLAIVPGAALIATLAAEKPGRFGALLATAPLQALGRLSYSLYVSHFLTLELLGRATRSSRFVTSSAPRMWLTVAGGILACLVVGALVHRYFEEPVGRALRSRLDRVRLEPSPAG